MSSFSLPSDYPRIKRVHSFDELVTTRFSDGVNALCWQRDLPGDFAEIVALLGRGTGILPLDEQRLLGLPVSADGRAAVSVLLEDLRLLREQGLAPELNCIYRYPRDETAEVISTDVYSYHADSAPVEADTYLCTYHGWPSQGLRQEEAQRRVDDPVTRAELLRRFGGSDDGAFQDFLEENCYHLHYASRGSVPPFSFGIGNLWRIALEYPGSPVPPCIHRAPAHGPADPPRLLLIS